ncbi:PAS domain-containing protein [Oscillatoria sp. FACHB-1407]|uniref:chemotaxis protein CheB n=1 Tax=Oscillatoria sp. FACHB-1407 TaxID=2692847 RepID=UPI001685449B|nr:chemotaxis protein CheB [Oscillatoria sp. FACHB-1407]MBD2464436.1 PAS domain-containing protein [Oscillatoria sp. FACHB-1407]
MTPRRSSKKAQPNPSDGNIPVGHPPNLEEPTTASQPVTDNQPSTESQPGVESRPSVAGQLDSGDLSDNAGDVFPVVGIGASAGGLEAFTQLLNFLPTNTGMAFVIIQHMTPDQESVLNQILARVTRMPVYEAQDGMAVAPNQVYLIPPNQTLTIAKGLLKLSPRPPRNTMFMSVDTFLLSLAEDRGSKAIAVILSGADSDGARGVEAVKAAGGITIAQCQESAQVESMPNTAIATGQVDFILPPDQIAQKLAEISHHPYITNLSKTVAEASSTPTASQDALTTIFNALRKTTGVDFTHYKQTTLNRRIQRRMVLYQLDNLDEYARYLQSNPAEVMALYRDCLIHVTSFFRDPDSFQALKAVVFPIIIKDKSPSTPIRIWVAGCSTGEEAYSIAICLLEFLSDQVSHVPIQIYATDLSETAIEYARNGIYTPSQVANVSPDRLYRFFIQVEGGYQISKAVRELCVFARQNLIGDPPFSRLDLITCRNVLIYLGNSLQKKLLPIFHYGLKSNGFLMLGASETVGDFIDLFTLCDKKNKIYAKKLSMARPNIELTASSYSPTTINVQPLVTEPLPNDLELQREADRIVLNQYAPAGVVVDENLEILQFRGQTSPYLEPAPGRASLNLLRMAKEQLRRDLQSAVYQARQQKLPVRRDGLQIRESDYPSGGTTSQRIRQVIINVTPFQVGSNQECFLVLFEDAPMILELPAETEDGSTSSKRKTREAQEIIRLKQELATSREHLQSIIEEQQATNQDLRAANEEILSSNEELQSTNEELETAKEEIQAANEELNTVNDELRRRTQEATQVSNDLQNLLNSIHIPILMLGADLQIRQFTPAMEGIFNLISTDIGRPLSDITHKLSVPNLEQQILEVIRTLNLKTQEIQDRDGHWYHLRIRPYRTIDNKIDGAVLVLIDIDDLKRSNAQLMAARDYADAIVETVWQPLIVLNENLYVITANRSFYETFEVSPMQTEQHSMFELGNGQWNIPQLRSHLEAILASNTQFQDFEVEHDFEQIGRKVMRLKARKMPKIDNTQMILLAIEDITDQPRSRL